MEQKKELNPLLAGLLIAVAVVAYSVIMTFAGGAAGPQGGWISYLIIIIGLVLFINRFGAARNHRVSFGELFSYGFKATTMVVLLFVTFLFILSFITPEIKQKVLEATQLELEKQKSLTDRDVDQMLKTADKYFWVVLIGTTMFFFVLVGSIGSLIGAAITKKEPANPFDQTGA